MTSRRTRPTPIYETTESVDTWKNRRRMTWVAVIMGLVVYPSLLLISGGLFPNAGAMLETVQVSLYSLVGGIVLSYFGGVTAEDIMKNRSKKDE